MDFDFRPTTYFENSDVEDVVISTIYFSTNVEINLRVKKLNDHLSFFIDDDIFEEEFKFSLKETNSSDPLSFGEIVKLIINEIKDCEGNGDIIFREWEFQYHEFDGIDLRITSQFYPEMESYFETVLVDYEKKKQQDIKREHQHDKLIFDHIEQSDIETIVNKMLKVKYGRFGIQDLRKHTYEYVKKYYLENGKLPIEEHTINNKYQIFFFKK